MSRYGPTTCPTLPPADMKKNKNNGDGTNDHLLRSNIHGAQVTETTIT
jgi:hypothetical protein